jgi:hypothetical protein
MKKPYLVWFQTDVLDTYTMPTRNQKIGKNFLEIQSLGMGVSVLVEYMFVVSAHLW